MADILIEGKRLRLRRATNSDLDYIIALEYAPENLKFIVPYERDVQEEIIASDGSKKLNLIIEERDTDEPVGYLLLEYLDDAAKNIEWSHIIIGRKGLGYGHETLKLLKAWTFEVKKYHRAWVDCKDYNEVGIHLYESEGMKREGLLRDVLLTDGVYENLIIFSILESEYFARKYEGRELD